MRSGAILILALLIASCGDSDPGPLDAVTQTDPGEATAPLRVSFDCGGVGTLIVDFDRAAGAATIQPPAGNIVMLPQRKVDRGFHYEADGYSLKGQGSKAVWAPLMADPVTCTVKPEPAP
jgi:hypothetical protein